MAASTEGIRIVQPRGLAARARRLSCRILGHQLAAAYPGRTREGQPLKVFACPRCKDVLRLEATSDRRERRRARFAR